MASVVECSAAELGARRLARIGSRLMGAEIGVVGGAIREALPRELEAARCHSKVLGIAFGRDGRYVALYALNRRECEATGCTYGDDLVPSRGEPGLWQALDDDWSRPWCEWRDPEWDARHREWYRASGWCRYPDPATGEVVDSFVARFEGGVVIAGSFPLSPRRRAWTELRDPKMRSRLLYPNPVCLLTVGPSSQRNCMAISWLTPAGNDARFVLAIHGSRRTAQVVRRETATFGLSAMPSGCESLVMAVGGISGFDHDKEAAIHDLSYEEEDGDGSGVTTTVFHVRGAVAKIWARVERVLDPDRGGHCIVLATMEKALVCSDYWKDGKLFAPTSPSTPPLLSFLGSKQFAHVTCAHSAHPEQ